MGIWTPLPSSSSTEVSDLLSSSSRPSTAPWTLLSRSLASSAVSEVTWTKSSQVMSPISSSSSSSTSEPLSSHSSRPSPRRELSLKPPRPLSRTWPSATCRSTWPPSKSHIVDFFCSHLFSCVSYCSRSDKFQKNVPVLSYVATIYYSTM